MDPISAYFSGFLLATIKFMVAAVPLAQGSDLSYWEVVWCTFLGAFFSFNVFYFTAGYFMQRAYNKKLLKIRSGNYKPKLNFSKKNKKIVKLKLSPYGYFSLIVFGPIFLSIPIGSIILAKFYRRLRLTYWFEIVNLFCWANILTLINFYFFRW